MLVNWVVRGEPVNYGTDFKGGSQIQVEFARAGRRPAEVRAALQKSGFKDATVREAHRLASGPTSSCCASPR